MVRWKQHIGWIVFVLVAFVVLESYANETSPSVEPFLPKMFDALEHTQLPDEPSSFDEIQFDVLRQYLGKKIHSIQSIDSPRGYDVVGDSNVKKGSILTKLLAKQIVLNLWETGKYRDVRVRAKKDGDGVILLIHIKPMFRMVRLELEGNRAFEDTDVKRAIGFVPGATVVPDDSSMVDLRDKLLDAYTDKGFPDASASFKLETTNRVGEVVLVVEINEGDPDKYVDIKINGLRDDLSMEQLLRLSGLKQGIVRDADKLQERLDELKAVLFKLGYPDAKILDSQFETKIANHKYKLIVKIDTGFKTTIEFKGNRRLRHSELLEMVWNPNRFNSSPQSILATSNRILQYAIQNGLLHAKVYPFRRCYSGEHKWYTVLPEKRCLKKEVTHQGIIFEIVEGPQVEVEYINIHGASHFTKEYIREEIFAFMAERNKSANTLEPFSTNSLQRLIQKDSSKMGAKNYEGMGAVYYKPQSVYSPKQYLDVTGHIEDIYAEQGFFKHSGYRFLFDGFKNVN